MRIFENEIYRADMDVSLKSIVNCEKLKNKSIAVLGATGLLGSFMVDLFLYANEQYDYNIKVYAVSRKLENLKNRFETNESLIFIEGSVETLTLPATPDFLIHAASYGSPAKMKEEPVEIMISNIAGLNNLLKQLVNAKTRVLYVSSAEAGMEVDNLTVRACYPEGKKAAETLCLAYNDEYGTDAIIVRPCHTYGPTALSNDSKASSQFIMKAAVEENIEMYSKGEQERTYAYVADTVSGMLTVMLNGDNQKAYSLGTDESCSIYSFAQSCARIGGVNVEIKLANEDEKKMLTPIKRQIVDYGLLKGLGWKPFFAIEEGIEHSIKILRAL